MDDGLRGFLDDFYATCAEHDASRPDRLDRWRNLEPDSAQVLAVLARATRPRVVLELGTSNGYSTCWLADAARDTGAALTSVDNDASRTAAAADTLRRAGLDGCVRLVTDDAGHHLAGLPDGSVDLVFLDAERPAYVGYWPDLRRVLAGGGTLVVDNVLSHADQVSDFLALVAADPAVTTATVPTGAGLHVATMPAAASGHDWFGARHPDQTT